MEIFTLCLFLSVPSFLIFSIVAIMMMNNIAFIYINAFNPLPDPFRAGQMDIFLIQRKKKWK